MHELSLCQNVLDIIQSEAVRQDFHLVKRVRLEIGALACVEPDALRFGFSAVMRDTLVEHAVLEILDRPGEAWCSTCQAAITILNRSDACPLCDSYGVQVTGGFDMRIVDLEVE